MASCSLCNSIAGDKWFESFEAKRDYVLSKRRFQILRQGGYEPGRRKLNRKA